MPQPSWNQTRGRSIDPERISRATAVAQEYDALMGLSYVGLGLGFLIAAVSGSLTVGLLVGAMLCVLAVFWYQRHYGFVRPRPQRASRVVLGGLAATLILIAAHIVDTTVPVGVSVTLLAAALVLAVGQKLALRRVGLTWVHRSVYVALVIVAFGIIIIGLIPGFYFSYAHLWEFGFRSPLVQSSIAAALIIVGLTDHRRLTKIMAPEPTGGRA